MSGARDTEDPATQHWHLDRRVPIALIVAILMQSFTAVWWASEMSSRMSNVEHAVLLNRESNERLARVEATTQSIDRRLARMEDRSR